MLGTYQRLGLHVFASNKEVIKAAQKKLKPEVRRGSTYRVTRKAFYKIMLDHHINAQDLVIQYRL